LGFCANSKVCGGLLDEIYQVHEIFQHKFEQEAPPEQKLLQWEHKLFAMGNINYKPRSGST